jgi:two-component system LytT family sensor kinase
MDIHGLLDHVGWHAIHGMLVINSLAYYRPQKRKYIYLLGWCTVLSILWGTIVKYGLLSVFYENNEYISFFYKSLPIRFAIAFLITGCAAITSMLWYNLEEQKYSESRKSDAEKLSRDAELYKLRQQLQPHFLFNSLNSISALVGKEPEQARKMIQQLSEFLRGALKKEDHQRVTLSDELSHLQLYLDMEKMRFGHRLSTETNADEESLQLLLPPMLLQPIVENAIKFGLYDTTEAITITINAVATTEFLEIIVCNPYDPETSTSRQGTGFGLSSVRRRLYLLFARNDLLNTTVEDRHFYTTVKIPRNDTNAFNR